MERDILVYKLFLDDMRHPRECMYYHMPHMPMNKVIYSETDWVIVRSYTDFVQKITELFEQKKFPWLSSFDHDLSFEHYEYRLIIPFRVIQILYMSIIS